MNLDHLKQQVESLKSIPEAELSHEQLSELINKVTSILEQSEQLLITTAKTADKMGLVIPVKITIYDDRSYSFILKSPPASILLAKFANVKKGAAQPNKETVGTVTLEQVKEIATIKMNDLNTDNLEQAILIIKGTAKSMGIKVGV